MPPAGAPIYSLIRSEVWSSIGHVPKAPPWLGTLSVDQVFHLLFPTDEGGVVCAGLHPIRVHTNRSCSALPVAQKQGHKSVGGCYVKTLSPCGAVGAPATQGSLVCLLQSSISFGEH